MSDIISSDMDSLSQLVILCIGTDRCTGDSLGPLTGHKLSLFKSEFFSIYGTLDNPVHALNLSDTVERIYENHSNPYIIAVDASLGISSHIGFVSIEKGPLTPGLGVRKNLSPVGNISVTGIVNVSGILENMVLQTTRLSTVMHLSDCITLGLKLAIRKTSHLTCILSKGELSQPGV